MNRKSISDISGLHMSRNIPIAESTHIASTADETSLIKNSPVSSSSKFQWGGKMTPKRKATSPLLNNKSIFKSNLSVQRIDPQTYLDTQSKGLVSRIVKYHDISQRAENKKLPKSIYNKPGQFPIVNLRKNEIIYSPKRNQNSTKSIVRIPPPDSSIYDVASRSAILRTGSITNLSQEHSQINENEPLTHSGDETVPTRSVLDALKEISRKRINSEDLEIERHKKHCTETNDQFDGSTRINSGILAKRQRDIPVCTVISTEQQKKRMCSKNNDILSSLSSSLHMTTPKRKVSDMTIQPEGRQVNVQQKTPDSQSPPHKKQIRSDLNVEKTTIQLTSNDVLPESPLKISTPQIPVQQKQTVPKLTLFNRNYTTDVETKNSNIEDDEDEEKISFVKPKKSSSFSSGKNEVLKQMDNRKLALMLSCLKGDYEETDDEVDTVPEKKKDEEIAKVVLEVPKIPTPIEIPKPVAPKIVTPIIATTIPAISTTTIKTIATPATPTTTATTTPAKINLINFETPQKSPGFTLSNTTAVQSTTATVTTSFVLPAKTPVTTVPIVVTPIQTPSFGLPEVKTISVQSGGFSFGNKPATTISSTTAAAAVPSFGLAQSKPVTVTTTIPTAGFTIAKAVTAALPTPQQPTGGFSFGQNATTTASPSFGLSSVPTTTTTPSFGKTIIPTTTSVTPTFGLTTTVPTPVYGQNTVPASTSAFSQGNGATPTFGQQTAPITFGQTSTPTPSFGFNSSNTNTTPKTTSSDNKIGFSFGGNSSTVASPKTFGNNTPVTTTKSSGAFSFGQTQDSTPKTFGSPGVFGQNSVNEPTTTPSAGMFGKSATPSFGQATQQPSFGQNTNPTPATSTGMFGQVAPPAFGQNTPTTAAPPSFGNVSNTSSAAFSFGGGNNTNKATVETNMFKFGGSSASQANSQPSFGSVTATATPATTTNSTFSFSSGASAKPAFGSNNGQSAPSFGGIVTNSQSTPNFGNPAPNVNVFGGSSFTSAQNTAPPAQSSAFAFGGAQNLTTNNSASSFAFASNTAKPVATNSTPTFGAVANNTNNSAFSFGNNAPAPDSNKTPSGAFNFGSTAAPPTSGGFGNTSFGNAPASVAPPPAYGAPQQQQQQQQQTPANLFAVGPGSGTPQRRIRTATRRMK